MPTPPEPEGPSAHSFIHKINDWTQVEMGTCFPWSMDGLLSVQTLEAPCSLGAQSWAGVSGPAGKVRVCAVSFLGWVLPFESGRPSVWAESSRWL